jgi:Protein of unknown function (DUF3352)
MKNMRLIIGAVSIPLIVFALGLTGGCGKKESPMGNVTPAGVQDSAEKNSFKEVTRHLDAGGSMYVYYSTEQWLDGLSGNINEFRGFLTALPAMQADDRQAVGRIFDVVTGLIKDSGVEEISGFGASGIAREKGFYHITSILHHYPGRDSGYLWSMFGKQAHNLDGQDLLPATTAMAMFFDMDAGMLWSAIDTEVGKLGIPEAKQGFQSVADEFNQATGLRLDKVLASLGNEYGLVVTLDESRMINLPIPGMAAQFPEPGIMLVVKVKDDTLFNRLDQQMQAAPQVIKTDRSDLKMRTIPVPLPLPISLRPSLARSGDYLFIASSDTLIEEALAVKSGKKPGLKSTDEFKKLAKEIPTQGNQFVYLSEKFSKAMFKMQDSSLDALRKTPGGADMANLLPKYRRVGFAYSVGANTDEGWLRVGNSSQDPANIALLLPAVAVGGVLAAIAVPNFVRARGVAQNNACLNNLRQIDGAKQQWALETKAANNATPTWNDIRPYLRNGPLPSCPQGGTYTLNAVNADPTCSIPGHQLSR